MRQDDITFNMHVPQVETLNGKTGSMLVVMLIHGHFSIAFNKDLHIINPVKNQNGCDIDLTMRNCLRLLIIFKEVFR